MNKALKIFFYSFLLLFFAISTRLSAQSYSFRNFSARDGLPYIQVYAIYQDSKGNIWTGGYGGLSKFDGKSFTNFSPKDGLINHWVASITQDKKSALWVGTTGGISRYYKNKFYNYSIKEGLPAYHIYSIFLDAKGNLIVGTDEGLGILLSENINAGKIQFIKLDKKNGLPANKINAISQDKSGNIFLGTDLGISILQIDAAGPKIIKSFSVWDGLAGNIVHALCPDGKAGIWIGTNNGLSYYNKGEFSSFILGDGLSGNEVNALAVTPENDLWVGTEKGLDRLVNGQFSHYRLSREIDKNRIECLFVDFENNLWIGSYADGLSRFSDRNFVSFNEQDGLLNSFVFPVKSDIKGNIWVGTDAAGLFKYDGKIFSQFGQKKGLPSNKVNDILPEKDVLWVATASGLAKIKTSSSMPEIKSVNTGFPGSVNALALDKKGSLWLGSKKSVIKYDKEVDGKFIRYELQSKIPDFDVWFILADSKDNIWLGTYLGGLYKFDGKEFKEFGSSIGIKSDSYLSILEDKDGKLYFGTFEGIFIYNPSNGKLIHITEADGLNSDLVYAMTFDNNGDLWAGTNQGVNRIKLLDLEKSGIKKIRTFGKEEGFSGVECNSNGVFKDSHGLLWWGTVNGLIRFDPLLIKENPQEARLSIGNVKIAERDTFLQNGASLPYFMNNMEIYFNGISMANPDKLKYSYILSGFDKEWSEPQSSNFVRYSNLPSGNYKLMVKCTNSIGNWNKQTASLSFTINPPFWKSWWFVLACFLIASLAIDRYVRHRIRLIKLRERNRLEQKIRLALTELRALRAQMNPHFIFNSLNSIQHFIINRDTDSATHYLNKFARLMRTILNNSERASITLQEEIDALRLYLELESMRFEGKFDYRLQIEASLDMNSLEVPPMIIQPYIENAIIHGMVPNNLPGILEINMKMENKHLICSIIDNGIGRKLANEKQIKNTAHHSMGMSLTRDSLEVLNNVHNSNLSVNITDLENEKGESLGTKVDLFIPIN